MAGNNTTTSAPDSDNDSFLRTDIYWPGLGGIIAFYLVILGAGALASYLKKSWKANSEDVMVAGRDIGLVVGIFTMTATWVGGGYINGTAEYVLTPGYGLVWCQAPVGYAISLVLGGFLFAKKMREAGYVTMLDPFQQKYGRVMTALLYIPALFGDIFWTGAILSALGASLTVIVGLDHDWAVIISAIIAVLYTLIGGLYSVAFTDVIQLICIFVGLWLAIPFALTHDAVTDIRDTASGDEGWLGTLPNDYIIGNYIDSGLLLIFGGIPWQVYFQRVLSQRTAKRAQVLSILAGIGCIIMAIPAIIIGAIAKSTDWSQTDYEGPAPSNPSDYKLALPLVMQYLTPTPVAIIALGAVSAAVMSSADSSVLSSSSMFARNIYTPFRNAISGCFGGGEASDREVVWVMRVSIFAVGALSCVMAIVVDSVYSLWFLCSDLVYVILFPQLLCVMYMPFTNTYGSLLGYILGWIFRLSGGEPAFDLKPFIDYPWYDEAYELQQFPFKTMTMLISLIGIVLGSLLARLLFRSGCCPDYVDIFGSFEDTSDGQSWQFDKGEIAESRGRHNNQSYLDDEKADTRF